MSTTSDIERMVDRLFTAAVPMSASLRDKFLALGAALEPHLIRLIEADELFEADARGRGLAPVHALKLLGCMKATGAIPRMIEILVSSDDESYAHGAAHHALVDIGAPVLEPCLAAHAQAEEPAARSALIHVLGELGTKDERVYPLLLDEFTRDPGLIAGTLASHGDPRAIPILVQALDSLCSEAEPDDDEHTSTQDAVELVAAIIRLGGAPRPRHVAFRDRLVAHRRALFEGSRQGAPAEDRPGRNAPCPCGSGKKYKKCHLVEDELAFEEP